MIDQPLHLQNGATLKNRIVKAAMSDSLGNGAGQPTLDQIRLYERWAAGGAALLLIGEVQVDPHYPEKPGNLVMGTNSNRQLFERLAQAGHSHNSAIWPQLGHAGALSHRPISNPKGPSPLDVDGLVCQAFSVDDIEELPSKYARAAAFAKSAGFSGVQIHAGHGFLLGQFLSPLFNHREDQYGGSVEARFRIIGEIIDAVRLATGPGFSIGIKINATDGLEGGLREPEALETIGLLNRTTVDLIEISGGTYFPGAKPSSDMQGTTGPYYAEFAGKAKLLTHIPIVVTGGFKQKADLKKVLQDGKADMVGLARLLVLKPDLPNKWLGGSNAAPKFPVFQKPQQGAVTAWYTQKMTALAHHAEADFSDTANKSLKDYDSRDNERTALWRETFNT